MERNTGGPTSTEYRTLGESCSMAASMFVTVVCSLGTSDTSDAYANWFRSRFHVRFASTIFGGWIPQRSPKENVLRRCNNVLTRGTGVWSDTTNASSVFVAVFFSLIIFFSFFVFAQPRATVLGRGLKVNDAETSYARSQGPL